MLLCILIPILAAIAALVTAGGHQLLYPLAPFVSAIPAAYVLIFFSMTLGFLNDRIYALIVYPVVLAFFSLFLCGKLHWSLLTIPFVLIWLDLHAVLVLLKGAAGC